MTKQTSIVEYMARETVRENIKNAIGLKTPQFISSVASLVNSNPKLAECDQKSVMASCLIAATLDLPINQNLGFAYIIPYKQKNGTYLAQFQMGYKGFVQLAMRSGQFKTINVTDVREGEIIGNNRLTGEMSFSWLEEDREKTPIIGYVAYMELVNGFSKQFYMTMEELKKHASRYSQSYKRNSNNMNIWRDDFESMASKTVIKLMLSRYAPMTIDMIRAHDADQAVVTEDGFNYPDNQPIDPEQMAEEKETQRIVDHIIASKTMDELEQCAEALMDQDQEVMELYKNKETELKGQHVESDEVDA